MSSETIGYHVELQRGTTYKSALLGKPGPFLLGLGSIDRDGGFRSDKLKTYGGSSPEKLLVYPGDLYVSLKDVTQSGDLLGSIARVPDGVVVGRMTQDTVKLCFKTDIPKSYFYWLLRTPDYRQYCRSHATGTTNLGLSRDDFFAFKIPEFTEEREKITNLLEDVENKININVKTNQTLEAIAQTLFKSWFVDFDPVKAKLSVLAAGGSTEEAERAAMCAISARDEASLNTLQTEQPETYAELARTAALFPSAMQDSELGEIPEGWEIGIVSDLLNFNPKRTLKKGTPAPYLDMKNVPTSGHLAQDVVIREIASGTKFINGDTLLARITPCLENGKTAYVDFLEENQVGWGSTEYIVIRPKDGIPTSIGYFIARFESFRNIAIQSMTGTSGRQRANADVIGKQTWIKYPSSLLSCFDSIAGQYLVQAKCRGDENRNLAELRNTLLPRLLAGEIDINKAFQSA